MQDQLTCKQMTPFIGRVGHFMADGFKIRVKVLDVRSRNPDDMEFQINPVSGENERWVSSKLVDLGKNGNAVENGS